MTRFDEKQALIDAVREQYSQGMITHLEFLNGAIVQVNDYNKAHITAKAQFFAQDDQLLGLELAIATANVHNCLRADDTQLNFYIC